MPKESPVSRIVFKEKRLFDEELKKLRQNPYVVQSSILTSRTMAGDLIIQWHEKSQKH